VPDPPDDVHALIASDARIASASPRVPTSFEWLDIGGRSSPGTTTCDAMVPRPDSLGCMQDPYCTLIFATFPVAEPRKPGCAGTTALK
jgi:hypothetical protein